MQRSSQTAQFLFIGRCAATVHEGRGTDSLTSHLMSASGKVF
ncbi:hypothetical protein I547_6726 [Mycobacterium kansasii 824]|uniref:Uncharacterized protein n=1 Tax=Mycobacterium kansasii TaxID=1768 RepID=A0A1V3X6Z0_MYCKA|nr:hypothetical protein I547_6726 [Mycobacterium kansasii 824]OOK74993.1 hypothetical protein BZL29_4533 [Mycobacterium kansasii]